MKFEIGTTLQTKQPFQLDIANVITGRSFIASITRWGKSWTCRKIVEQCFGHAGIIIIDPEGEYSSLREKFPFLIIGKDIPLQLETAEFMAEKMLESKISVIIDTSMVEDDETAKEYINLFLRKFFFLETTLRQPYLVVVEEAEDFVGERGIGTETTLRILINIVKKGGKRGIGALFVAHRPAWVSKGILSQISNKAIGKIESTDFEALEKYARVPKNVIERLPSLDKGEFCFVGDWTEKTTFVKVGQVQTTHLGATPGLIPPSPKELQAVIVGLQKSLPEVIAKIKPTTVPIDEVKAKIKEEMEKKYQDKIIGIQRTANEKAERKYQTKIEQLKENNDKLSRASALQATAPISNVFDHPIVRARLSELNDRTKDLLIKINQEPNLTRQQLAAFLTTSTDAIANLVDKVNDTFKAKILVGEGKPMQYKSQLVYFFGGGNTKEVQELERLQSKVTDQKALLEERNNTIFNQTTTIKELKSNVGNVKVLEEQAGKQTIKIQTLETEKQALIDEKKDLLALGKTGEALNAIINSVVDRRIADFKPALATGNVPVQAPIDMTEVSKMIDEKIKNIPQPQIPLTNGEVPTSVTLEHKITHFDFQKQEEHVKADTTSLQGRIIYLITKDFFAQRHNPPEVITELTSNGWMHDKKDVAETLLSLCQIGIFMRKFSTGNYWWYSLTSEAKERIHS